MILGAVISCIAAGVIASGYRRRMRFLMQSARTAADNRLPGTVDAMPEAPPPTPVTLADNRAAGLRLTLLLVAISVLIALSSAWMWWTLTFPDDAVRPKVVAVIALL